MAHKVHIYENGYDEDGVLRPSRVIETDDADEAVRLAREELTRQNFMMAADVRPDWRLCETIADYVRLGNTTAIWLAENPIEGCFIGQLTDDPEHWAQFDVTTPEELEKLLLLQSYSDNYKDVYGVRPRNHGMTMDTPIEEIEAAYDRLVDISPRNDDQSLSL